MRTEPITFLFICCMIFVATLCCLTLGIIGLTVEFDDQWFGVSAALLTAFLLIFGWMFTLVKGTTKPLQEVDSVDDNDTLSNVTNANHNAPSFANYQQLKQLLSAHKAQYKDAIYITNSLEELTLEQQQPLRKHEAAKY